MTVADLVNYSRDECKQKKVIEEFVVDTAIKDHLNQLLIPFVNKLNENISKTKAQGQAAVVDHKKLETVAI
jgi:hypothetical protein